MKPTLGTPALDAWRRRATQSLNGFGPHDALWLAACWDQSAANALAAGNAGGVADDLARAKAETPEVYTQGPVLAMGGLTPTTVSEARLRAGTPRMQGSWAAFAT